MLELGTWVWSPIPPQQIGVASPKVPVEPCKNTGGHVAHFHSETSPIAICHGVLPTLPDSYVLCQVKLPGVQEYLPCKFKESGGYQCENLEPHDDEHLFGDHTIRHSLAGNGWSCEEIDKGLGLPLDKFPSTDL